MEKSWKTNFSKGQYSCKSRSGVTKLLLNLYYVMTNSYTKFQVNISKTAEKSPENEILAKGNNSYKSRSSITKLELDLYCVKTIHIPNFKSISQKTAEKNPKTKFQQRQ